MKLCTKCKEHKPLSEYGKQASTKDGLKYECNSCSRAAGRERYRKNPELWKSRAKEDKPRRIERARRYILEYLLTNPCVDCGNTDPRVLEFDHLRDKAKPISRLAANGNSIKAIRAEIEKCEVRCCNCHRIKTYERAGNTWHDLLESAG